MNITQSIVSERDRALVGGDYSTYHAQATRRIHKLRKKLGVATPKGRKYAAKAPVTAENVAKNTQWVQLLLACSERAWAEAMAMKSLQSPENTQKPLPGSTKRQITSRLTRAIKYAQHLVTVLADQDTSKAAAQDILEAKAYLTLLRGGLDFERNRWSSCIRNYAFVRQVYTALASASQSDLYRDLLQGTIEPSLRYAAYQEKLPRTKAVADIAIEHFPEDESASKAQLSAIDNKVFETSAEKAANASAGITDLPTTIEWRSRRVNLEDASISQALAAARLKESDLSQKYSESTPNATKQIIPAYDDVIQAYQDAVDATKTAIDELTAEGVDQSDSRIQALQVTRTAVNYAVIELRIGRNRVLCGQLDGLAFDTEPSHQSSKPRKDGKPRVAKDEPTGRKIARLRERVALYDSILQNLDAVQQLPGVIADTTFVTELDAKKSYFRALKCLAIARSHAVNGHITNALALFARAGDLAQRSSSTDQYSPEQSGKLPKLDITSSQSSNLVSTLRALILQYRALADLDNINKSQTPSSQTKSYSPSLLESLHLAAYNDQVDLSHIVDYPPKLRPIPIKPIFYDVAWNYIDYPGQEKELSSVPATSDSIPVENNVAEEAPKKRGWFSFGR